MVVLRMYIWTICHYTVFNMTRKGELMWLFGKKKKAEPIQKVAKQKAKHEAKPEYLENGELPWGWLYRNKDFVDKINDEYTYFLNNLIKSRKISSKAHYEALKSFLLYSEDVEKLCKAKGECHVFWFNEILTSPGFLDKLRSELEALEKGLK